jgi:hypothetical protein
VLHEHVLKPTSSSYERNLLLSRAPDNVEYALRVVIWATWADNYGCTGLADQSFVDRFSREDMDLDRYVQLLRCVAKGGERGSVVAVRWR